jgi:hypothetical protein
MHFLTSREERVPCSPTEFGWKAGRPRPRGAFDAEGSGVKRAVQAKRERIGQARLRDRAVGEAVDVED